MEEIDGVVIDFSVDLSAKVEESPSRVPDDPDLEVETWQVGAAYITKLWCRRCQAFLGQVIRDPKGAITMPLNHCRHFEWAREGDRLALIRR